MRPLLFLGLTAFAGLLTLSQIMSWEAIQEISNLQSKVTDRWHLHDMVEWCRLFTLENPTLSCPDPAVIAQKD